MITNLKLVYGRLLVQGIEAVSDYIDLLPNGYGLR
jgi:hypothetical protein